MKVGILSKEVAFFPADWKTMGNILFRLCQKGSCMDNVSSKQGKIFAKSAWKVQKSVKENDNLLFTCYSNF